MIFNFVAQRFDVDGNAWTNIGQLPAPTLGRASNLRVGNVIYMDSPNR